MKHPSPEEVLNVCSSQGLLPPFHHRDKKEAMAILDAAYAGGLRIIEFTNRSEQALEVFEAMARHIRKNLSGMILGAGTIMNRQQAKDFYKAGASFLVSPILEESVGKFCREENIFWCPGAFTPTEIIRAQRAGATLVKLFPAEIAGPAFLKAFLAPCPAVPLMPSGGVTLEKENLKSWFEAGATCVAIGSHLFGKEILKEKNYALLKERVHQVLENIREIRAAQKNLPNE